MLPKLEELLTCRYPHVLARYTKEHAKNSLTADEAFCELMKYLWLTEKHAQDQKLHPEDPELDFSCAVHFEMTEIDDMWHTFLLFTKEYADFCNKYFGKFMHHAPEVGENKPTEKEYQQDLERYLSYVYDNLGEETVRKWFQEPA